MAALLAALAACSDGTGGATAPVPISGNCVALFQQFDAIEASMSSSGRRRDSMVIRPELQGTTARIRQAGCVTFSDSLRLDTAGGPPVADSGPKLVPPMRVHAGAVTSMADDAAARAFFEAHGVATTSIGSPALGRRIYIGPFATRGALEDALALARNAGFAYPYPARF